MKLRKTILKYHSWYLCQISLQIMLLPIQSLTVKGEFLKCSCAKCISCLRTIARGPTSLLWHSSQVTIKTRVAKSVYLSAGDTHGSRCRCGEMAVFKVVFLVRNFTRLKWGITVCQLVYTTD